MRRGLPNGMTFFMALAAAFYLPAAACKIKPASSRENAPNPAPKPARRLTSFLGVDLRSRYDEKSCIAMNLYAVEYTFDTVTCLVRHGKDQNVYALYLTDDRVPHLRGRILRVYASVDQTIFGDDEAMRGYLEAAEKKYGPLRPPDPDGRRYNMEKTLICGDKDTTCDEAQFLFDPKAHYNNQTLALLATRHGKLSAVYHEYSLMNATVFDEVHKVIGEAARRRGAAAIE